MKKLKYLAEYILFIIMTSIFRLFSIDKAANFCAICCKKIGPYLPATKIARKNIESAINGVENIDNILTNLWDNFGRYIGEFSFINQLSNEELDKRVEFIGLEKVKKFQDAKQPFLIFLAHQANWDIMIRKSTDIYPEMAIIYRPANNPYIDKKVLAERVGNQEITMIAKGREGAKDIVKAIKSKKSIAMLVDQKMNEGIEVPFFGKPAMTAPAIARFALQYNYPIIPIQLVRKKQSSFFQVIIHSPLEYQNTGNREKDCYDIMLSINKTLEKWIMEKKGQWFWFHNRWKK